MATVSVSRVVPADPERAWELVGGFHALPDWMPSIQSTPLQGGMVRRLVNPDGAVVVERMEEFNHAARYYTYSIVEAPFPVEGYLSNVRVYEVPGDHGATEVVWSVRFASDGEAAEAELVEVFTAAFRDGLETLHKALSA
ncbi:SRPBCC family protein [Microbispora corallina]|uniref:MxaD family protein n=1 Tax=Microbispora corallina TaxID=83302 RepID=A0ABQ4FTF0_9ACTN|nr:SRPBCC family protein [Microbispora corallina]GIH38101.1 MxaD family protein [Microbispora corallina]